MSENTERFFCERIITQVRPITLTLRRYLMKTTIIAASAVSLSTLTSTAAFAFSTDNIPNNTNTCVVAVQSNDGVVGINNG